MEEIDDDDIELTQDEQYSLDIDAWVEDIKTIYDDIETKEKLKLKDMDEYLSKVLDIMSAMIVQIRILKEEHKIHERLIMRIKGVDEAVEIYKKDKDSPPLTNTSNCYV